MRTRVGKRLRSLFLAAAGTLGLTACDASDDAGSLKLTNALEVDAAAYPAVVQLMAKNDQGSRFCTGFFVNEYQLLTAAHCVHELSSEQPELFLVAGGDENSQEQAARALRYHVHDAYERGEGRLANPYDLAVVDFPVGSARHALRLSSRAPRASDAVTLVGYGEERSVAGMASHADGRVTGKKRYGQNSIKGSADGILSLVGVPSVRPGVRQGQYVATAQGDSGGPVLLNSEVAGMMVAVDVRQGGSGLVSSISYAIDLSHPASREFLDRVLE